MDNWEKELLLHNIQKSLNVTLNSGELEGLIKANYKKGDYADTPMNREKGIVGVSYNGEEKVEEKEEGKEQKDEKKKEKKEEEKED